MAVHRTHGFARLLPEEAAPADLGCVRANTLRLIQQALGPFKVQRPVCFMGLESLHEMAEPNLPGAHDAVEVLCLERCSKAVRQDTDGMWREKAKGYGFDFRTAWAKVRLQYDDENPRVRRGVSAFTRMSPTGRPWI